MESIIEYKPGQVVPVSGIYTVLHDPVHQQAHEITCVTGEPFPPCHGCGTHPRYRLARATRHVVAGEEKRRLVLFFHRPC